MSETVRLPDDLREEAIDLMNRIDTVLHGHKFFVIHTALLGLIARFTVEGRNGNFDKAISDLPAISKILEQTIREARNIKDLCQ